MFVMKRLSGIALLFVFLFAGSALQAQQDKAKRPSPPAAVSRTLKSGATISINYSQPALKGRTIGKNVEPMNGEVWRMGANEATIFETDREVTIDGKTLAPGKYSLFGISGDKDFTLIFNKAWDIWGTNYAQNKAQDVLQVPVKKQKAKKSQERLTYTIDKNGKVNLLWGTMVVEFKVK
jgi:Protein of unknown function (DUF2911)